jgi:hypothetical protein
VSRETKILGFRITESITHGRENGQGDTKFGSPSSNTNQGLGNKLTESMPKFYIFGGIFI